MKHFLNRWLLDPLASAIVRLRFIILGLRRRQHGRWIHGDYSNSKAILFYAPFLPPKRNYQLYVPAKYDGVRKLPLVVMLHGCGQNPETFAAGTGMNQIADREGFLVLYP